MPSRAVRADRQTVVQGLGALRVVGDLAPCLLGGGFELLKPDDAV